MKRVALAVALLVGCSLALDLDDQDAALVDALVDATLVQRDARPTPDAHAPVPDARTPGADARPPTPDARPDLPPGCSAERCNELDDDCDGAVDEDWPGLGDMCVVGLGRCERRGMRVCLGDADGCDAVPGQGREEACDRVDDDCDGVVDEGTGDCCEPGEQRPCGRDIGACVPGNQVCGLGGRWGECMGTVGASLEACNGGDDDCDAAVDEGLVDCDPCVDGAVEVCNGRDDDCDGTTDEGLRNACGACGPLPREDCDGIDDDCDGEVDEGVRNACALCGSVPEEVCNERDDDCDGRTDERVANACGRCGDVTAEVCNERDDDCDGHTDEGLVNACGGCGAIGRELCNGADDDCDGTVDEDYPSLGEMCTVGVGVCERSGRVVCAARLGVRCSAEPGLALQEVCGGEDEDCDGRVDEGLRCGCVDDEVCNDIDDDCDERVDEDVRNACDECGPVPEEVCNDEDDDCDGETDEGALNACGVCGDVPEERCTGQDEDCDGVVDEGFLLLGRPCTSGVGACRVQGTVVCAAGGFNIVCDGEPGIATDEECNDVDDDCDGGVDEGVRNACGACGDVPAEVCNQEDDDCDGQVDEAFFLDIDVLNCGGCGQRCVPRGDRCVDGQCRCGRFGPCSQLCIDGRCEGFDDR